MEQQSICIYNSRYVEMEKKLIINLQLFAEDEKTEEATPKRKDEARQKGQIAKSMDIPQVATLLTGVVVMAAMFKFSYQVAYSEFLRNLAYIKKGSLSMEDIGELFSGYALDFFLITGPIFIGVLLAGLISNYVQVGFLFTWKPLIPSFNKINPFNGLKNLLSIKKVIEVIKTLIKLTAVGIFGYIVIKRNLEDFLKIPFMDRTEGFALMFKLSYDIVLKVAFILFVIAVIDYFYQRWEYNKSLKMSKQEIKEEYKQTEGDPQIKARMRAMQRSMIRKRMLQEVPKATVVITNPTHLSIAIRYEQGMRAPVVVAKGADNIAMKIREIAQENGIPLLENKPLAQALYKAVEVEQEIPEEYYQAVAEVLKIIFRKRKN